MHFDANPPTLDSLSLRLRTDPRVLRFVPPFLPTPPFCPLTHIPHRHTTLKLGVTFEEVTRSASGEVDPTVIFHSFPPVSEKRSEVKAESRVARQARQAREKRLSETEGSQGESSLNL
jgi:hypothetical protein